MCTCIAHPSIGLGGFQGLHPEYIISLFFMNTEGIFILYHSVAFFETAHHCIQTLSSPLTMPENDNIGSWVLFLT